MRLVEIWRYPVKSLQGEQLDSAEITPEGVRGDRRFAIFDASTGFGLTARRAPQLLFGAARLRPDGRPEITLPDGSVAADDSALSDWLGRAVQLRSADDQSERHYEDPADFEDEAAGRWGSYQGSAGGPYHDSADARVTLVSTPTLRGWDGRRFRSNLVFDADGEDELVGSRVALNDAVLRVVERIERCVLTTRPQPGGIDRNLDVLRTIHRERNGCLAVGAVVVRPGAVQVGEVLKPVG